jgi:NAD(P)-dependent dehydrogenase (short-subunit alcohol dehydrogenase family)
MDAGLTGRVVLVTGAGGGAGPTFCRAFAAEGAALAVHYRGSAERAEAVAAEIVAAGGRAAAYRCDLGDSTAIERMVAAIAADLGPILVAVNNTSDYRTEAIGDIADDSWATVVDDMLGATFRVSRAVAPQMTAQGFGRIVNLASRSGLVGVARAAHYAAAKAGIVGLTRSLAKELGPAGILVNAVAPTVIVTERDGVPSVAPERQVTMAKSIPIGRLATPDDIARVVVWLGSAYNSFVNGEVVTVSGGARA